MNKILIGLILTVTAFAGSCGDKYGNCKALAKNCCPGRTLSNGMKTSVACCKSCAAMDNTPMCKEKARIDIEGEGRNSVKFMKEDPNNRDAANSACTDSERAQIMDSVRRAKSTLDNAYRRWNKKLFTKWFGKSTTPFSDVNVKIRFKKAIDMLYERNKVWELMCCKKSTGACKTCGKKTLAYVSYFKRTSTGTLKYSNTHIRICPLSFTRKYKEVKIGMTMFHELVHMSSGVSDKGYSKR